MFCMQNVPFNLLFAGHDTSASALTLLLRYLTQQPEVLQKLREEQRQVEPYNSAEPCATPASVHAPFHLYLCTYVCMHKCILYLYRACLHKPCLLLFV